MKGEPNLSGMLGGGADSITRINLGAGPNRQAGGVALGSIAAVVILAGVLVLGGLQWLVPWVLGAGAFIVLVYFGLAYAFAFRHPLAATLDSVDYAKVLTNPVGMKALPDGGSPIIDLRPIENPKISDLEQGDA